MLALGFEFFILSYSLYLLQLIDLPVTTANYNRSRPYQRNPNRNSNSLRNSLPLASQPPSDGMFSFSSILFPELIFDQLKLPVLFWLFLPVPNVKQTAVPNVLLIRAPIHAFAVKTAILIVVFFLRMLVCNNM